MKNLIPEILTDEQFTALFPLLHKKNLRNYQIVRDYKNLRKDKTAGECYKLLSAKYKNLHSESIRKIINDF